MITLQRALNDMLDYLGGRIMMFRVKFFHRRNAGLAVAVSGSVRSLVGLGWQVPAAAHRLVFSASKA